MFKEYSVVVTVFKNNYKKVTVVIKTRRNFGFKSKFYCLSSGAKQYSYSNNVM